MTTRVLFLAALCCGGIEAGITLTPPGGLDTGFFDGASAGAIGSVSYTQLPEQYNFAGIKVYGTATSATNLIQMIAIGGTTGKFDVPTILQVKYDFTSSVEGIPFQVEALVGTTVGGYYGFAQGTVPVGGHVTGSALLYNLFENVIPAGMDIEAWTLLVTLGNLDGPITAGSTTLTIPANSVDLVAYGETVDTPEAGTWGLVVVGLGLLGSRARRSPFALLAGRRHLLANR